MKVLAFQAMPPLQFTCQILEEQGASILTVANSKASGYAKNYFKKNDGVTLSLDLKHQEDRAYILTKVIP